MQPFTMVRDDDVTGYSGTGEVADGVVFPDGVVVIRWRGEHRSTVVWDGLDAARAVHGHDGRTRFVCEPCKLGDHFQCRGGTYCDCQHR